ncbi:CesT family type III secretion system chaperone [Pseudomonas sp. R5-89-07]|uniref:CesT family type III secretion system chaperone n=1 Tax=Pseudomonas sp. R5-89-07 TaxID=658644 RepID=UPI000F57B33E|nr:CesT family type III secretion system chaperone [Pseudomonas sp. R5-89-07]
MAGDEVLMAALSQRYRGAFSLQEGVCVLGNAQHQETVVIEMPVGDGSVLLHCRMERACTGPQAWRQILEMNFPRAAHTGCWLALDELGELRLCSLMPKRVLNELIFCDWVSGFMKSALDMRDLLAATAGSHRAHGRSTSTQ